MQDLLPGQVLDQYQVIDVLARSGMSSLYRARDVQTGRTVVLKVPHPQYESDIVFHQRFSREEEIGLKLNSPAVIKVFRPEAKSRVYLAMEYVEGETLRARMDQERELRGKARLPIPQALRLADQLSEAVAYLHSKGIVHRDLKPENVMLLPDGGIKIMDFGISLDRAARRMTWAGFSQTTGTPDYMAPEQVQGKRGDERADVYSLGVILYEMLTGSTPFGASSLYAALEKTMHGFAAPPRAQRPEIPEAVEELVLRALARDPANRPASAAQFREWLEHPEGMKSVPLPPTSESIRWPTWGRTAATVVMVIAGIVAFAWVLTMLHARRGPG